MAYMERRDYCRISKIYENARVQDSIMRKRIANVKSNLDNRAPADSHLRRNTKKEIMMEERYADIEKQNLLLLQRMHTILHSPGSFNGRQTYGPRSMNIKNRREELMRISRDNHMILERIQAVQPMFDAESLRQDAKMQEKYVKRLSLYASGRKGDPSKFVPIQPMRPQSAAPLTNNGNNSHRPSSSSSNTPGSPGAYHSYRGNKGSNGSNQTMNGRMRPTSAPAYSHYTNNNSLAMTAPASLLMHPSLTGNSNNNMLNPIPAPLLFPNGPNPTMNKLYPSTAANGGFIMPSFIQPVGSMGSIGSIPSLHSIVIPPSSGTGPSTLPSVPIYQAPLMTGNNPTGLSATHSGQTSRSVSTQGSINNGHILLNNPNPLIGPTTTKHASSTSPLTINTTDIPKGSQSNISTATSLSSKTMTTMTTNGNDTARSTISTMDNNNNTINVTNNNTISDDNDNTLSSSSRPRSASNQNSNSVQPQQPGSRPASARMMRPESAKGRRPGSGRPDSAGASRTTALLVGPSTVGTILESTEDHSLVNNNNNNNNASSSSTSTTTTVPVVPSNDSTVTPVSTENITVPRPNSASNRPVRPESARPGSARNSGNTATTTVNPTESSSSNSITPPSPTSINRPWSSSRRVQFQQQQSETTSTVTNENISTPTVSSPSIAITESLLLSPLQPSTTNKTNTVDISIASMESDEASTSLFLNTSNNGNGSSSASVVPSTTVAGGTTTKTNVVVGEDDLADDSFIKEDPAGDDADSIGPDHHDPMFRGGPNDSSDSM